MKELPSDRVRFLEDLQKQRGPNDWSPQERLQANASKSPLACAGAETSLRESPVCIQG